MPLRLPISGRTLFTFAHNQYQGSESQQSNLRRFRQAGNIDTVNTGATGKVRLVEVYSSYVGCRIVLDKIAFPEAQPTQCGSIGSLEDNVDVIK